jgi:ubiquinone/menaquinone biosynthesis C-methylase UbiE
MSNYKPEENSSISETMNIVSDWTRQVERGQQPSSADLRDHLTVVHDNNAGFTEEFAWNCRNTNGQNSYELLTDIVDPKCHANVLDLACGSGVLLDLCYQRFGNKIAISGIDMSNAELQLAHKRLAHTGVKLNQGMAQDLTSISDASFDVILCHWALTLMDPVAPVFSAVRRVLKKDGVFAAIIDGDMKTSPSYSDIHNIIYSHVQREYPDYGVIELGDPRVRTGSGLQALAEKTFFNPAINITPLLLHLNSKPDIMARVAAGFFYASFVLSGATHQKMLVSLEDYFSNQKKDSARGICMPVNLMVIRKTSSF